MSRDKEPKEEIPHIAAVRRQWRLRQRAAEKPHFKVVDGEFVRYMVSAPADDLATTVADAVAAEGAAIIAKAEIGQMIEGRGIFFGTWEPKDRDGNSLGKIFNVFAAPQDLTDDSGNKEIYKYVDVVKCMATLKNWHGHDGTHYENDKELHKALKDGSYNGGWIIPTRELLAGTEADGPVGIRRGKIVQADNLLDHQNKCALKGTFNAAASRDGYYGSHSVYWSCTEYRDNPSHYVWSADFMDGEEDWNRKNNFWRGCRPVRLELRS